MEKNATVVFKTHNGIDKNDYVKGKISYLELNPKYFKASEWARRREREREREWVQLILLYQIWKVMYEHLFWL